MNILSVGNKSAKNSASFRVKFYALVLSYIQLRASPKHIGQSRHGRPMTISHVKVSFVLLFIGNSVADGKDRDRRDHRAQRFATTFETLKSERRDDDAQRPRGNTEGKGIRGEKKDEWRGGSCRTAQQNHLTQRERETAKPTVRIRGNRRVGAGFRLSVAIATSAALWLGERAADGKSLVRTIIPRVAILQSGPSRSVVLHPRLHTSRCFRLSLRHVAVRRTVALRAEESLVVSSILVLYDVTVLQENAYFYNITYSL